MREYIIKRLLLMIPSLIGVSLVVFSLAHLMPGDVVLMMLTDAGGAGSGQGTNVQGQVDILRAKLGLDKPLWQQYLTFVGGALRGDLGKSLWTDRPVTQEILERLPITAELALLTIIFSTFFALLFGVIAAIRQDSALDYSVRLLSIGGLSFPDFWIGTLVIIFPAIWFGYMAPIGYRTFFEDPLANLQQFLIPAMVIGLQYSAGVMRLTRSSLLEVLRQDYIRTAWAKGLRERSVIYRHALKNALIPVVTLLGAQLSRLLGGTVVIEAVFGLPGLGRLLVESIGQRDLTQLQGNIMFIAATFLIMNLIVDLSYAWLDPRIKY